METIKQALIPDLQSFAQSTDLTKEVFSALAKRERAAARSDIDAIYRELQAKSGKSIDYAKYLDVWRLMENKKLGTVVYGRQNNPNRFVWKMNFRDVSKAALETAPKPQPKAPINNETAPNSITFVIPSTVPMEEILALINLGTQLASKIEPNTNKK